MHQAQILIDLLSTNKNNENIDHMEKYMRNQFKFLGIKTPERRKLLNQFFKESQILKEDFHPEFVEALWQNDYRECQYAAIDYIARFLEKLEKHHILLLEFLITEKSWWDTVDMLAQKAVGTLAKRYPEIIPTTIESWVTSDNMWLQRSAILFQLKYKEETDEELLYRYLTIHAGSKEFFIQKAIGWVLREYSKTNAGSVKQFIAGNQLAKLSVREGRKYLD